MVRGQPSNTALKKKESLALARQACLAARKGSKLAITPPDPNPIYAENQDMEGESSGDEVQCTGWSGGVAHYLSSDEEPDFVSEDEGEEEDVEELSGSELEEAQRHAEQVAGTTTAERIAAGTMVEVSPATLKWPIAESDALSAIMDQRTDRDWKKAENTRSLGYNGQSARTKRLREKVARDKETEDVKLRKG